MASAMALNRPRIKRQAPSHGLGFNNDLSGVKRQALPPVRDVRSARHMYCTWNVLCELPVFGLAALELHRSTRLSNHFAFLTSRLPHNKHIR